MATYFAEFKGLDFSEIKHHQTKQILAEGDIVEGDGYCGVVYLHNINWDYSARVIKASVNLYITPFAETNPKAKKTGFTDSRVMMEELSLWEKFEGLKLRACDEKGYRRQDFDVIKERELFFGFERKNDVWCNTCVTLNSWIKPIIEKEASDAVINAGIKYPYRSAKLTNLMPKYLWLHVLPRLEKLTPYDGEPWTVGWATEAKNDKDAAVFAKEELARIRCLVLKVGKGSKLYLLDLSRKSIGKGGLSTVIALASVLQEEWEMIPRCANLQRLRLSCNKLTDEHIVALTPTFGKSSNLEVLDLNSNQIGDEGCVALSRSLPRKLEGLYLSYNNIGDYGCKALMACLPSSVSELDLRDNAIGSQGCSESINMWKSSQREGYLSLSGNPGHREGNLFLSGNSADEKLNVSDSLKKNISHNDTKTSAVESSPAAEAPQKSECNVQ